MPLPLEVTKPHGVSQPGGERSLLEIERAISSQPWRIYKIRYIQLKNIQIPVSANYHEC